MFVSTVLQEFLLIAIHFRMKISWYNMGLLLMVQKSGKLTSWGKVRLASHYFLGSSTIHSRWLGMGFLKHPRVLNRFDRFGPIALWLPRKKVKRQSSSACLWSSWKLNWAGWHWKSTIHVGKYTNPMDPLGKGNHQKHIRNSIYPRWWFPTFSIFIPIWGWWSNMTDIFQVGWNHQPVHLSGQFTRRPNSRSSSFFPRCWWW